MISSVMLGYIAKDKIESLVQDIRHRDITAPNECRNLTLKETAYCLNNYVDGIFKYKSRPDLEKPTLEELIEEGGDCKNWAELYVGYIDELGFDSSRPIIYTGNETRHAFAVISDETGYCILDQTSVECFSLKVNS